MVSVILFLNGENSGAKIVDVPVSSNLSNLLQCAAQALNIEAAQHLYTPKGILINDVHILTNYQILFVSRGEPFIPLQVEKPNAVVKHGVSEQVDQQLIRLNVGGMFFTTTRETLLKEPASLLAKMIDDKQGTYVINRNPAYFSVILDYLRAGTISMSGNVNFYSILNEAAFFGLESLVQKLKGSRQLRRISIQELGTLFEIEDAYLRAKFPMRRTNFEGLELSHLNFSGLNLEGSSFRGCRMKGVKFINSNVKKCDFEETDLTASVFSDSLMEYANFANAHLSRSTLKNNNIKRCVFTGANLSLCEIENSTFDQSIFNDANLSFINILKCHLNETAFLRVNLENAKLINSSFVKADLRDTKFKRSNVILQKCDMSWANLANSEFSSLSLDDSNFSNACLRGAKLEGNLRNCKMQRAVLKNASLGGCNLNGCILTAEDVKNYMGGGVAEDLRMNIEDRLAEDLKSCVVAAVLKNDSSYCLMKNTDLTDSNLYCCDLTGSDLIGANFLGADVSCVLIEENKKKLLTLMSTVTNYSLQN